MHHDELATTVQTLPEPVSEDKPQRPSRPTPELILTKQHRRFVEFCDAVRRDRYIGLCYGPPGVGKTLSARTYAHADTIQPYLTTRWHYTAKQQPPTPPSDLDSTRTAMWTPAVTITPRQMTSQVTHAITDLHHAIEDFYRPEDEIITYRTEPTFTELLIVDEADRLKTPALEHLRDVYDRAGIGLILIGMPGIERRLARYPQLYSRVGFAHRYEPLTATELTFVLTHH